ncbi:host specificity protein J, partial [Salmonella enterica]|nr:host specificity protein J [Salmonella enterica]
REITLPESGTATLNIIGPDGKPFSTEIQSQPAPDRVVLKVAPDTVPPYSVWGLKVPSLKRRLFRCVRIKENDDGTYAITAVQHVPEKEAIVDNGAHFDPLPGTINSIIPPAVQHLTVSTDNDSTLYQARAKWDTPRVVKGVRFVVRLTTGSGKDDDPVRLVTTATTSEAQYAFHELPRGDYTLAVRAINGFGQQGAPSSVTFSIQAPAAPSTIELTPGYFQITVTPYQATYDASVQYEFWYSGAQLATAADIQSKAQYLGTGSFWLKDNLKPAHDAWFYIRSVNLVGKSVFVEASGQPRSDADGILNMLGEQITKTQLSAELFAQIDNSVLEEDIANVSRTVGDTKNEIEQTVSKTLESQSATIQQIQKVQKDTDDNLNALYMLKVQKTKDGVPYVAGIGAGIEDVAGQTLSQILLAANRIAFIDPSNGNTTPMLVARDGQVFVNEMLVKYLSGTVINAPTITSGGNPPAFSLTPDGRLTARNADISGNVNALSGTLSNMHILNNCQIDGTISATKIIGDIVKAVLIPQNGSAVITAEDFSRVLVIPCVSISGWTYSGGYGAGGGSASVTASPGGTFLSFSTRYLHATGSGSLYIPAGQTTTLTYNVSLNHAEATGTVVGLVMKT